MGEPKEPKLKNKVDIKLDSILNKGYDVDELQVIGHNLDFYIAIRKTNSRGALDAGGTALWDSLNNEYESFNLDDLQRLSDQFWKYWQHIVA